MEWNVSQVAETTTVDGSTSIAVETAPVGSLQQDRQLVFMFPTARFDLAKRALMGVARAALWWLPGSPVYCKIVNRSKDTAVVEGNRVIARMITLNVRDLGRFESLFDEAPSTVDPLLPLRVPDVAYTSTETLTEAVTKVLATDTNLGTLGSLQRQQLIHLLEAFIVDGLLPIYPKRVPVCIDGGLELPLIK